MDANPSMSQSNDRSVVRLKTDQLAVAALAISSPDILPIP